ncbi:zinc carboxypeptidase, partial [Candidatus Woesearchaeota archaeon]|nr:zinc carboxypeptidase [Candidatus Woesearchaeota archaeon]
MLEEPRFPKGIGAIVSYLFGSLKKEYSDFFDKYHPYEGSRGYLQILEFIAERNSDLVSIEEPGISTEGRQIPVVRLSSDHYNKPNKIMITGMIHGREFISGEVCLGILENMLCEQVAKVDNILADTEVYFLPVLNPDAFVQNIKKIKQGKRFGKLTRQNANGVDLNRNFGDNFAGRAWTNKHQLPIIGIEYAGEHAFSEKEPQFLKEFVQSHQINGAINLHSFTGAVLYPPFSTKKYNSDMEQIAQKMCQAMSKPYIAVQGSRFLEYSTQWLSPIITQIRHPTVEGTLDGWLYNQGIPSMVIEISQPALALAALSTLYAYNPPPSSISFHKHNCFQAAKAFIEE